MEQQPLLSDVDDPCQPEEAASHQPSRRRILMLLALIVACLSIASDMIGVPMVRIIEDAVCRSFHNSAGPIDERLCKTDEVQAELTYIIGVQDMLDAFSSFIFALPYGFLADRIGRAKVFTLSLVGITTAALWAVLVLRNQAIFQVRAIWVSSAFQAIGGGNGIPMTMVYSIVADVQSESARTNTFFYMNVCSLLAGMLAPSISARLMDISPWCPLGIGLIITVIGIFFSLIVPETLPKQTDSTSSEHGHYSNAGSLVQHARQSLEQLRSSTILFQSRALRLLLATFLIEQLTTKTTRFGIRYMSRRFGWSIARFGYFLSFRAGASILMFLLFLPALSTMLQSSRFPFRYSASAKDLLLARASSVLLVLGSLLAASPVVSVVLSGYIVSVCGTGFSAFCRSLATGLVGKQHTGMLYTTLNIVDTIGAMLAGPVMSWAFILGMKWGVYWLGLPYLLLAALGSAATGAIWFVRLPDSVQD